MPTHPPHSYLRASGLAALTVAMTLGGPQAPALATPAVAGAGMHMHMPMGSSTPEHVAEALAALNHGDVARARSDLRQAVKAHAEPMDARMHAKEALAALRAGDRAAAAMHATGGAAVEHLTYALRAVQAGHTKAARAHLTEAAALPKVRSQAKAALAAIKRGDRKAARHHIAAGLIAANRE